MDQHSVEFSNSLGIQTFPLKSASTKSIYWTNAKTKKLLDWIEAHDSKYVLQGNVLRSAADEILNDKFSKDSSMTADRIRARLIEMKSKYEETLKWLQLQKKSSETDKCKIYSLFLFYFFIFIFFILCY